MRIEMLADTEQIKVLMNIIEDENELPIKVQTLASLVNKSIKSLSETIKKMGIVLDEL